MKRLFPPHKSLVNRLSINRKLTFANGKSFQFVDAKQNLFV